VASTAPTNDVAALEWRLLSLLLVTTAQHGHAVLCVAEHRRHAHTAGRAVL
jgi:hypothetical protein